MSTPAASKKKKIIKGAITGVVMIAVLIAAGAYFKMSAKRLPEVNVTPVSRGDISQVLDVTGKIVSENTKTVYSKVSAIILECGYEKGDEIKKGDKLVTYDTSDFETALSRSKLSGRISELDIEDAEGFNSRKGSRYDEAQYAMDERINWIASRKEQLDDYQEELIAEQTSDSPDIEKMTRLQFNIEEAKTDIQEMKQQLTTATNTRDAAKEALISDEQQDKLAVADEISDLSTADIEKDLAAAKAGVDADFGGIITEAYVKSGAAVSKGQPLFTIASADDVSVKLDMGQKDLSNIVIGQDAIITSVSHKYKGTVDRISHTAMTNNKDKQVVSVYVRIDEPDEYIIIDMEAKASINLGEAKNVLIVPSETVHENGDDSFCYVLDGSVIKKRMVTTGLSSGDGTQITEGLSEGELVLWSLPDALAEGDLADGVVTP